MLAKENGRASGHRDRLELEDRQQRGGRDARRKCGVLHCLPGIRLQRKWKAEKQRGQECAVLAKSWAAPSPPHPVPACPGPKSQHCMAAITPLCSPHESGSVPSSRKRNPMELVMPVSCFSRKPSQTGIFPAGSASSRAQKQQFLSLYLGLRASSPVLPLPV